ncbi:MAG: GCN5-like N-acetyltransferase [Armatimonadetes bacterium]|jgi:RimJ/RimL family protein N-acetyltransferase|nr:GCN5-like N-acetyltransferase [Armatimonadota bacterium]
MFARLWTSLITTWRTALAGPSIHTERLHLREWREQDWEALFEFRSDPRVLRYLQRTEPYSQEEAYELVRAKVWVQHSRPRYAYDFAVVLSSLEHVIGEIGLVAGEQPGEAYLGFIVHRDYWGNGYATEAARALVAFGFEKLKLRRVIAGCDPANNASENVLLKLGMRPLGPQKNFLGSPAGVDALAFELTREHWSRPAV